MSDDYCGHSLKELKWKIGEKLTGMKERLYRLNGSCVSIDETCNFTRQQQKEILHRSIWNYIYLAHTLLLIEKYDNEHEDRISKLEKQILELREEDEVTKLKRKLKSLENENIELYETMEVYYMLKEDVEKNYELKKKLSQEKENEND